MSHTSKTLKSIAASEDYNALVSAIEEGDYQTLYESYMKISSLLEEAEREIQEKIENLPRQNKDDDRQKFQLAFTNRSKTTLPQWYRIKTEIQKQKITEGVVFSMGKKGDPMAKTPEGRIVIVSGSQAKEGDKVTLKVVAEGDRVDFGKPFEFTPESFYLLLNQEVRQKARDSLDAIQKQLENFPGDDEEKLLPRICELLIELEEVREHIPKLQENDRKRIISRIHTYRRHLLDSAIEKLVFDFISAEEEKEITELCGGDEVQGAGALSAPGLFRTGSFQMFREGLFEGDELKGYTEMLGKMERELDTMNSALELMEFKAEIDKLIPKAKLYMEKMERLFRGLQTRARRFCYTLADDTVCSTEEILARIREAFSEKALGDELRRIFRSSEDFFDTRGAAMELKARMGDKQSADNEATLKPYLQRKVNRAFGKK